MSTSETAYLAKAILLAMNVHRPQRDQQGRDYFEYHLKPIAESLAHLGQEAMAAGYLHDIIEDHPEQVTLDRLRDLGFPESVVSAVDSVTRRRLADGAKEPYADLIERACLDPLGVHVKLADNAWNLRSIPGLAFIHPTKAQRLLERYLTARDRLIEARVHHQENPMSQSQSTSTSQESTPPLQKGDWVQVWAQVVDPDPHPENYTLRLESHNEQYKALVRRDRVVIPGALPDFAERCTRLFAVEGGTYDRCMKHEGHPGLHTGFRTRWAEEQTDGFIEENR